MSALSSSAAGWSSRPLGLGAAGARAGSTRVPAREVLACAVGLGVLALVMCARHIGSGGLYYDDWSLSALARFPPPGGVLHGLWLEYGQRPGQVLYYAALDAIGTDASARLALAAGALVLEATCLFALLRQLGMAARDAIAITVLVLLFPYSDSAWLWGVLSLMSIAIAAFLAGVMLALRALQATGPRALALHAASLSLFVASIASYEVFAVVGCLSGLLYLRAVGWRAARRRWALDLAAIALTLTIIRMALPIDVATPSRMLSPAGMLAHAGLLAGRGVQLIGTAALPVGGVGSWVGAGLLAAVLAGAAALRARLADADPLRADLGRWLAIAGAGGLVALAGWAIYVPGAAHYAPTAAGTVNRVNAAAAIGIAVLLYSAAVLLARALVGVLRLPAVAGALIAAAATIALAGAYLVQTASDARAWDTAAADQQRVLADVHSALAHLAPGATVYAFDAPLTVGSGVGVLDTTLDLSSALRISYANADLTGVPLAPGARIGCARSGVLAAGVLGRYGAAYLLDVGARSALRLRSRSQCSALAPRELAAALPRGR